METGVKIRGLKLKTLQTLAFERPCGSSKFASFFEFLKPDRPPPYATARICSISFRSNLWQEWSEHVDPVAKPLLEKPFESAKPRQRIFTTQLNST